MNLRNGFQKLVYGGATSPPPGLVAPHPQDRAEAISHLSKLNSAEEAVRWALRMAEDEDYAVREAAVRFLGEHGDRRQLPRLRLIAAGDDLDVSVQAVESMRSIADRDPQIRRCA